MSILLIEEIQEKVIQVANKYDIPRVYLFGSYARNTATEESDVDLVIDSSHIADHSILYDIEQELEEESKCHVDIIEYEILTNNNTPCFSKTCINFFKSIEVAEQKQTKPTI